MPSFLSKIPRYALFALLIFTPLARASVQPWAVTVIHLVTLITLTAFLIEKTFTGEWKWIKTHLDKPIIILLILCILSTVFSVHWQTSAWSSVLLVNYLVIFYLVIHTIRTRSQFRQLVYLIIAMAAFLSIFGLLKYSGLNPFPWWQYPHQTDDSFRMTATFGNADHLAGYMEMALPLLLGLFLTGFKGKNRFFLICLTCFFLNALILPLSRGAWFGAAIAMALMAICLLLDQFFQKKRLVLAIAGGTMAIAFIVFSTTPVVERILTLTEKEPEANLASRIKVWSATTEMIKDYPILGIGPGTYAWSFTEYQPPGLTQHYTMAHNDYLHFISEIGLFLIPIIIWMMIALYRKGFRKMKNPSRLVRGVTLGAMSGITAILVHSFVDFNLHIPSNALLFTVLIALMVTPLPIDNYSKSRP